VRSSVTNELRFALTTLSDDPVRVPEVFLERALVDGVVCRTCRCISPGSGPIDIQATGLGSPRVALNFTDTFPSELKVARTDFLDVLGDALHQHLALGEVRDATNKKLPGYVTLRAKGQLVLVRGGAESEHHGCCPECGNIVYLPIGGPWHVLRSDLPPGPIHLWLHGLLVDAELVSRLERGRWKKLSVSKVRVVDEPLDGHPADLTQKVYVPPKRLTAEERQRRVQEMLERWRQQPRLTKDDLPPHLRQMADDLERWKQEYEDE